MIAPGSAVTGNIAVFGADRFRVVDSGSALSGLVATSRTLTAGNGLTGGGNLTANRSFAVLAADASIVVGAGGVAVGVLQSDAMHGNRGGGAIHADAIASGAAGFMTGADKALLDSLVAGGPYIGSSRTLTAGNGLTGGGDLSANRTFTVLAADSSISVGAGGIALAASIPNATTFAAAGSALSVTNNLVVGGVVSNALGSVGAPSYSFTGDLDTGIFSPGANQLSIAAGGVARITYAVSTTVFTPAAVATGSPTSWTFTQPAHTNLTTATENTSILFNLSATKQFATGAITTQREYRIQAPTYGFVGASTITTAATLAISGPPIAGTNATLTQTLALYVESGQIGTALGSAAAPSYSFVGDGNTGLFSSTADTIDLSTAGTARITLSSTVCTTTLPIRGGSGSNTAPTYSFTLDTGHGMFRQSSTQLGFSVAGTTKLLLGATTTTLSFAGQSSTALSCFTMLFTTGSTSLTASTEVLDVDYALNRTQQWATGALATQRHFLVRAPTIAFVGASTVTTAATVAIAGAPVAGTNATITTSLAFWVQAGGSRFDGNIGFFSTTPAAQQTIGAVTNSVTSGGTDGTIANFTDLTIYANDSAAIRNDIYQLARSVTQIATALRAYGLGV